MAPRHRQGAAWRGSAIDWHWVSAQRWYASVAKRWRLRKAQVRASTARPPGRAGERRNFVGKPPEQVALDRHLLVRLSRRRRSPGGRRNGPLNPHVPKRSPPGALDLNRGPSSSAPAGVSRRRRTVQHLPLLGGP